MHRGEEELLTHGRKSRQSLVLVAPTTDQPQASEKPHQGTGCSPSSAGEDGSGPEKPGPTKRPIWSTAGVSMLKEVWRRKESLSEPAKLSLVTGRRAPQQLVQGQETSKETE